MRRFDSYEGRIAGAVVFAIGAVSFLLVGKYIRAIVCFAICIGEVLIARSMRGDG